MKNLIGYYSFIVGVIIALVLGIGSDQLSGAVNILVSILIILGFVAGALNIYDKKKKDFLITITALVVIAFMAEDQIQAWESVIGIGKYLVGIFYNILFFLVPAAISALLKDVFNYIKGER